jgi:hypothetical protein
MSLYRSGAAAPTSIVALKDVLGIFGAFIGGLFIGTPQMMALLAGYLVKTLIVGLI